MRAPFLQPSIALHWQHGPCCVWGYGEPKPHVFSLTDQQLLKNGHLVAALSGLAHVPDGELIHFFDGPGGFCAVLDASEQQTFVLSGGRYEQAFSTGCVSVQLSGPVPHVIGAFQPPALPAQPQTHVQQAFILGAGIGSRILPLTTTATGVAKPALPLPHNTSVIGQLAQHLHGHGLEHLWVNVFYEKASVIASVTANIIDEPRATGTAGALHRVLCEPEAWGFNPHSPLLITQGDAVTNADFSALVATHVQRNAVLTIGCQTVADEEVSKFGIIAAHDGIIQEFHEKPQPHETTHRLASTGFYVLSPEVYPLLLALYRSHVQYATEFDFAKHVFPAVLQAYPQRMCAAVVEGYWSDIGNPGQYWATAHDVQQTPVAQRGLLNFSATPLPAGVQISGPAITLNKQLSK